jgi:hypothetical protein
MDVIGVKCCRAGPGIDLGDDRPGAEFGKADRFLPAEKGRTIFRVYVTIRHGLSDWEHNAWPEKLQAFSDKVMPEEKMESWP